MKIELEFPYNEYVGYTVINPEGRKNICLVHKIDKTKTTVSYARYLLSVKEGRILLKEEHVDHIDGNKTRDEIENLQILSLKENNNKKFKETCSTRKMLELKCPSCEKVFQKEFNQSHIQKKGYYTSCSRACSHKLLSKGLSRKELEEIGKSQIIREYRK